MELPKKKITIPAIHDPRTHPLTSLRREIGLLIQPAWRIRWKFICPENASIGGPGISRSPYYPIHCPSHVTASVRYPFTSCTRLVLLLLTSSFAWGFAVFGRLVLLPFWWKDLSLSSAIIPVSWRVDFAVVVMYSVSECGSSSAVNGGGVVCAQRAESARDVLHLDVGYCYLFIDTRKFLTVTEFNGFQVW